MILLQKHYQHAYSTNVIFSSTKMVSNVIQVLNLHASGLLSLPDYLAARGQYSVSYRIFNSNDEEAGALALQGKME